MSRFAHSVISFRYFVLLAWVGLFAAGLAGAGHVSQRLSQSFSFPGEKGFETNQQILRTYGNGGSGLPAVVVVTLPVGETVDTPGVAQQLGATFAAVQAANPRWRLASWPSTGDRGLVSADGRTTIALVFTQPAQFGGPSPAPIIRAAVDASPIPGASVHITGLDELQSGSGRGGSASLLLEATFGALGALAVLALVFGSGIAVVPIVIGAVSILTALLAILGLTTLTNVNFIVEFLVSLIGLGVAIDYSLLIVTRWREERLL